MQNFSGRQLCQARPAVSAMGQIALWVAMVFFLLGGVARAQQAPLNDNFVNATVIFGSTGSTKGNNSNASLENGENTNVITADNGSVAVISSVWFEWTAPTTGNVTFDTLGSTDGSFNPMDTVLAAYTGQTLKGLKLVTANDNASASTVNSSITFYATAGTTYYLALALNATNGLPGTYFLNWTETFAPIAGSFALTSAGYTYSMNEDNGPLDPRGDMRQVSAHATITRTGGASGMVDVVWALTNTYYTNYYITNYYVTNIVLTLMDSNDVMVLGMTNYWQTNFNAMEIYENYTQAGGYQYYTRNTSGSSSSTNVNQLPPIYGTPTNYPYPLNPIPAICGLPPDTGMWTNTDLTIVVGVTNYFCNTVAVTNIISSYLGGTFPAGGTNVFQDFQMNEDITIPANGGTGQYLQNPLVIVTLVTNYLDSFEDPTIPAPTLGAVSNSTVTFLSNQGVPGIYGADALTNNIVNLERYTLRCDKSVNGSAVAVIGVTLSRGNNANAVNYYYRIDYNGLYDNDNQFTLQAGSDYARPDAATKFIATPDFTSVTGELTWPQYDSLTKYISIPITQDQLVKFNKDIHIQIWNNNESSTTLNCVAGDLTDLYLTELYTTPAAGTIDTSYNADANPYTSPPYNSNPGANGVVYATVVQPLDGKAVIGGDFSSYNNAGGASANHIARILVNGQLDTTFNSGNGFDADVQALAIDANQEIIAVGAFKSYNNTLRKGIARINPDGSLDNSFNPGLGADDTVWTTAIQPDGQILVAGKFTTFNSTNRNCIARLNPDGSVDASFDPGVGPNADIYSVAVQTNGQIVIGGAFTSVDGNNLNYIARLNADGSLDKSFNPGYGFGANANVNALAVQPDGKILLGGLFTTVGNIVNQGIARLNSDGTVDTTFESGSGASDEVNTISLQSDGTILIGGWFTSYNQTRRISIARLLPNGLLDTSFLDTAYNQFAGLVNNYYDPNVNPPNPVYALAVQPDGNVLVGGSFYQVGGGATRDDIHPRQNFARLVGGATPGPGNVELNLPTYTAQSSSSTFYIQVDRTNGALGSVSATVSAVRTGSGTGYAAYNIDYTFKPTLATWTDSYPTTWQVEDGYYGTNNAEYQVDGSTHVGLTPVTMNIVSNNNNNVTLQLAMTQPKGMDTFFLGGENIPLAVALGNSLSPMTIIHNNPHPGILNFSSGYYYVAENGGNATITVTRTSGTDNAVSVHYATTNGTAQANVDYRAASGTLNFVAGQSSATFTVPIINNSINRPDRIFAINLSVPGNGVALGTVTNTLVEIVNDNYSSGHVQFTYGALGTNVPPTIGYGTNENSGPILLTLSRLGGNIGSLSVTIATTDGSAANKVNYIGFTNTVTWTNLDSANKTIPVTVLDDGVITPNLTANVSIYRPIVSNTNAPNALGGVYTNATLTITNVDSGGLVQFTTNSYFVNENAGYAIIPVYRTGGSIGSLSINYATSDGTASSASNYVAATGTLVFAPGQVSTNFVVWINDLGTPWISPLNFQVTLSSPISGVLGSNSVAQININGSQAVNQPPGQTDTTLSSSVGFNNSVFALTLQADGKLLAGGDFTTADGVPRNRVARLNTDGSLDSTFSSYLPAYGANSTVRSLVVQDNGLILIGGFFTNYNSTIANYLTRLNADASVDSSFNIGAGPNNPVYSLASTYVNGARTTVLGGSFTMVNGTFLNGIARLLDNGKVDTTFNPGLGANASVYAVAVQNDGKILIGGDFTSVNGASLNHIARLNQNGSVDSTFNPGAGANDSVRAIAIQLDGQILIGGLFTNFNNVNLNHLARLTTTGAVDPAFNVGLGANGPVETIALQSDTRIVIGGDFTEFSGVTRNRLTRLNPDGTVDPTINFGTGADGFVAASVVEADGEIDFGGGFQNYNSAYHPYFNRIYGGSLSGSGAFQFSSSSYQVDERGTNVFISIVRTGGTSGTTNNLSGAIDVIFSTSDGSGVAPTNYTAVLTNVYFPAGEVLETVAVPVHDDGLITTNLTVNLNLTNAPDNTAVIGSVPNATLNIINDDSSVSFGAATYTVAKNNPGGVGLVNVVRQGSVAYPTTLTFATGTGTAAVGTDYTPVNTPLTFNVGVSNLTIAIPINNNGISEGNRTISLLLTNISASYAGSPSNAVLTIIDTVNVPGQFQFSATNYNVTEGGGAGYTTTLITVLRTNGSSGIVSVNYSTFDQTALNGLKYIATNGILSFGDGETSKSFQVSVLNTTTAEGPETFGLVLYNPTGGSGLTTLTNSTVTILNTNVGIAFVVPTNSFIEPAGLNPGAVNVSLVRFNNLTGTNTVNYSTLDGSPLVNSNAYATAGRNYLGVTNGTLTFKPGEAIKTVPITTYHDSRVTGNLYFTAVLSNPSAGVQLTSPTSTLLVDQDVDAGLSFLAATNNVYKNQGFVTVNVVCSNTNVEPVQVSYTTGGGTAVAGVDYITTAGTLTFTNGQSFNSFVVPILPNNLVQSNKYFNVSLVNPVAPGELVYPSVESITIVATNTPFGLSFGSPTNISGAYGSVTINNTTGSPEAGDPTLAGNPATAPVWFVWTAPADGEVTLDTIGSTETNGVKMDTVMGVFTGNSLATLNQVAVNDDLYPNQTAVQVNEVVENIYNTNNYGFNFGFGFRNNGSVSGQSYTVTQPFTGPSGLRFNARAGVTYYIDVDSKASIGSYQFVNYPPYIIFNYSGLGLVTLNWAYHPAGVFRFATETVDQTGILATNANPTLLYQCSETEGGGVTTNTAYLQKFNGSLRVGGFLHGVVGPTVGNEQATTDHSYYSYDVEGLLVTITRVGGAFGRVSVDYTTEDGDPSVITNGDLPAIAYNDYTPVHGTLTFDDFEMSKTIRIPIADDYGFSRPNRDFVVALSNPQRDPLESGDVSLPRVDPAFGQVVCRILDCDIDPKGPTTHDQVVTNTIVGTTNTYVSTNLLVDVIPTNGIFNFSKSNYRVCRDVQDYWVGTPVTIYVNRMGTNRSSVTVHYRVDNIFLDNNGIDDQNNEFPLQPASDYATPYAANPPLEGDIYGSRDFDYGVIGGPSGTLTFPGGNSNPFQSQPIHFRIFNHQIPEFNKDFRVTLYTLDSNNNPLQDGMVAETTVTILFDDTHPPAGSVDEFYNPDFGVNLALLTNSLGTSVINPGTEPFSEVYSLALLPTNSVYGTNQTIIAGAFTTYSDAYNTYTVNGIARLNPDGSLDNSFQTGAGINVFPGGEFIRSVLLSPAQQIYIGGDFTSYNGVQRNSIARLNYNGTLDNSFNVGAGVNGTIWAMALQPDGKLIIAGDFSTYNNIPAKYVARLNSDGSLDTTFNCGTNLNAAVYAIGLDSLTNVILGGAFKQVGGTGGQNRIVRLTTSGSLDPTFNTVTGPNAPVRTISIQSDDKVLAGGEFTLVAGQSNGRLVRFNTDGSIDSTFNSGIGADGTVYNIQAVTLLDTNGNAGSYIYAGGSFTSVNGTHRLGFTRLYADGTVDTTFMDTAYNQFAGLPRIFYGDAPGTVYASGVQADGNVMIVGSFSEVGGGQADYNVRNNLEQVRGVSGSFTNTDLYVSEGGTTLEPKSRDGVRIRGNVARLIGGITPGPGNIGFAAPAYAVNKTQPIESVSLIRTNGNLGYAAANFQVVPNLAHSGVDYSYSSVPPIYPIEWEYTGQTRVHTDGLTGANGLMTDNYGLVWKFGLNGPASIEIGISNNPANLGNLNAGLQLANPIGLDQFYLGGQNIPMGVALAQSTATLTLVDNSHQDGVFGFSSSSYVVTNALANVPIARTSSSFGTVQVSYKTVAAGSTATAGTDYLPTNGTVVFNPGASQTTNTFPIVVLQNSYIGTSEKSVNLQLYNLQDLSSGNASLGLTNAVLRLVNPNFAGYLTLSSNFYTANEGSGFINFIVNRTVGSKGTLSIQYQTADGSAVNHLNYVGTTNVLTWNNGDASPRVVSIPLINTFTVGSNLYFTVNLANPTLNNTNWAPLLTGSTVSAQMNIVNTNNFGTFQFAAPTYRVNENGGTASINVIRTGSLAGQATVSYATADGSALGTTNYMPSTGTLTFANGQSVATINLQILNDGVTNPPPAAFYFNVGLLTVSPTNGASLGIVTNTEVQIVDAQTYNQVPGAIDSSFDPNLIVNGSILSLALQYSGDIVLGGLFTAVNGTALNHVARLNTDGTLDANFLSGLSGVNGNVNVVLNQTDDRVLVGGSFNTVNGYVRNNIGRLMTDGSLDTSFVPGAGADNAIYALGETFVSSARKLYVGGAFSTFNGQSSPGIVRLNNDGSVDTSFNVGLGANGAIYAVAPYGSNAVNNAGQVLVGGAFTNFNNNPLINLVRLNGDGSLDTNFTQIGFNGTVRALTIQANGQILVGGSFTLAGGQSVNGLARLNSDGSLDATFNQNLNGGINGTVDAIALQTDNRIVVAGQFTQANHLNRNNITRINGDGTVDPTINFGDGANGAVNAVLVQPTDGFLVVAGAFTVFEDQAVNYITRLDGGSITGSGAFNFSAANYQVTENGGLATITVVRSGGSSGPTNNPTGHIYVTFSTTDGTAHNGTNYTGTTNVLDFALGQVFQALTIPVMDDQVVTPNLIVSLSLTNPTAPAGLGDQATAQLTIINVDSGVSFSAMNYNVPKNTITGVANIDVVRLGSTSGSCTVNFTTTTNGTAVSGVDYYPTNATITFAPGVSDVTVQVPIINNGLPEGPRTIGMTLTNALGFTLTSPTNATLTIQDTVNAPGQLYFVTNSYTVLKANGTALLTVGRTNGSSGIVSINYYTLAGTASPGINYLNASGTLTLVDGQTSGNIAIPLLDNNLAQGTVNFGVNLWNPGGGASLIQPTNSVVNIVDHNTGVSFVNTTNYSTEANPAALVLVQRIGATNAAFSVTYVTTNNTALAGTNYYAQNNVLNFGSGETLKVISVPLIQYPYVTGDLLFGMYLTNVTAGAQLVNPTNTVVVIHDSHAGLGFDSPATNVLKTTASITLPVICSNPSVEPVVLSSNTVPLQVNYYTTNGTGKAGLDYTAVSGTLVFTNGNATNYITVPVINNGALEGNRTFDVILASPTAPGQLIYPATNTVTIIDINSGVEFSSPGYTVQKTGVQATINVYRTGYTNSTVTVNYAATNLTAVAGVNYQPVNGTLTFTNGVTNLNFTVPIISSTVVQPDLTVLLQLSNPTNAGLIYPSFATLTIVDPSGSTVYSSGASLISESGPVNGLIDSNETVTVNFGFRNPLVSGLPVGNLKATLLTGNGVTNPSATQVYGAMAIGSPTVARPFTFKAVGTNGSAIIPTFALYDGSKLIGTNTFTFYLGTWQTTYSNAAPIIINDFSAASPYPAVINISGQLGQVLKATVTLTNVSHTAPGDIETLVVAPNQSNTLLMGNDGAGNLIKNVTLTFDDAATNTLPQYGTIVTSTNRPTSYPTIKTFP